MKTCSVKGCDSKCSARDLCNLHYQRLIRNIPMEGRKKLTLLERINLKIIKRENGCWEWTGAKSGGDGREKFKYGYIRINGKSKRVHRVLYKLINKTDLKNQLLCHRCDNPLCVNPEHLFVGTHKDNSDDMFSKKRDYHPRGENNHSKLKEVDVLKIRQLSSEGMSYPQISSLYGVTNSTVGSIVRREKWKHI